MNQEYSYTFCCVDLVSQKAVEALGAMIDAAGEVTYRTLREHCKGLDQWAANHGYDVDHQRGGLRLSKDWAVGFYKSVYDGQDCYYIRWSAIEYVWLKERKVRL
jgi:hypothetical protein